MTEVCTDHDTTPSLEPATVPAQAPSLATATLTSDLFGRLFRPHLIGTPTMLARLDELGTA